MYLEDAEQLLSLMTKLTGGTLSFDFDVGIISCMYSVAWRCRYPALRRRAIDILRRPPKQESLWTSKTLIRIAERLIAFEEGTDTVRQLQAGEEESLPPESMRPHQNAVIDPSTLPYEAGESEQM